MRPDASLSVSSMKSHCSPEEWQARIDLTAYYAWWTFTACLT
ncbi:hypothetical protein SAMN05216604_11888 [Pseudomonas agarici]|nr:hypothetical protein SAMN05216604_11888 [Pseudomonas agarici]